MNIQLRCCWKFCIIYIIVRSLWMELTWCTRTMILVESQPHHLIQHLRPSKSLGLISTSHLCFDGRVPWFTQFGAVILLQKTYQMWVLRSRDHSQSGDPPRAGNGKSTEQTWGYPKKNGWKIHYLVLWFSNTPSPRGFPSWPRVMKPEGSPMTSPPHQDKPSFGCSARSAARLLWHGPSGAPLEFGEINPNGTVGVKKRSSPTNKTQKT